MQLAARCAWRHSINLLWTRSCNPVISDPSRTFLRRARAMCAQSEPVPELRNSVLCRKTMSIHVNRQLRKHEQAAKRQNLQNTLKTDNRSSHTTPNCAHTRRLCSARSGVENACDSPKRLDLLENRVQSSARNARERRIVHRFLRTRTSAQAYCKRLSFEAGKSTSTSKCCARNETNRSRRRSNSCSASFEQTCEASKRISAECRKHWHRDCFLRVHVRVQEALHEKLEVLHLILVRHTPAR